MFRASFRFCFSVFSLTFAGFFFACALGFPARSLAADDKDVWSDREKPIVEQLRGLRKLPDDIRAHTSKDLAVEISPTSSDVQQAEAGRRPGALAD